MREYMCLGSTPANEECAQVGTEDYSERVRRECSTYIHQLYRFLATKGHARETLPDEFSLVTKGSHHDFGTYYEVHAKFNGDDERSWDLAIMLENEGPTEWDEVAKSELNITD